MVRTHTILHRRKVGSWGARQSVLLKEEMILRLYANQRQGRVKLVKPFCRQETGPPPFRRGLAAALLPCRLRVPPLPSGHVRDAFGPAFGTSALGTRACDSRAGRVYGSLRPNSISAFCSGPLGPSRRAAGRTQHRGLISLGVEYPLSRSATAKNGHTIGMY